MDKNESLVLYNKGREAWNAWAKEMLDQQTKLQKTGEWMTEYDYATHRQSGENSTTQNWLTAAKSDFAKQIFENVMNFTDFIFPGDAEFTGATFGGKADFIRATFNGEADFEEATFRGFAYFSRAKFDGVGGFLKATFEDEAGFEEATFSSSAIFMEATFGGYARFEKATFSDYTWFMYATFGSEALFRQATFSGVSGVKFTKATFSDYAGFEKASFGGEAEFKETTFSGDVKFTKATFSRDADFEEATFSGYAKFWKATFGGDTRFEQVKFGGEAEFAETTFGGDAWFRYARFSGNASFQQVAFGNYAGFRNVWFIGRTSFCKATFGSDAEFMCALFANDIDFTQAIFASSAIFSITTFQKGADFVAIKGQSLFTLEDSAFSLVPDFQQAHFAEAPQLDNSRFDAACQKRWWKRQKPRSANTDVTARWRTLKRLAVQGHDHERELLFLAEEIKSSRGTRDKMWPNPLNLLKRRQVWPGGGRYWYGLLYQCLSNFGRSTLRPFLCWMVVTGLSALFYSDYSTAPNLGSSSETTLAIVAPTCDPPIDALYLSVHNGLVISGLGRTEKLAQSYACLYGNSGIEKLIPIMPMMVVFVGIVQTIISAVLIFLFLLALRNYFRIK